MEKEYVKEAKDEMEKSIDAFEKELGRVRTGRASVNLLDSVRVDYYGTPTPLNQLATLSVPEPRLITIKPWDVSIIKEIEKAILKSELGLTPNNDGKMIRVSIPALTQERRNELVKLVKKMAENCRVAVRNHRRKINDNLKQSKNDKEISEDEFFKAQEDVQQVTDSYIVKVDEIAEKKEKEILEF